MVHENINAVFPIAQAEKRNTIVLQGANMKVCDRTSHLTSDAAVVSTLCPKIKSLGGDIGRERCGPKVASS
jgi:hypothetical protein